MDGVIFDSVNFWLEVHKAFGTLEQGKILTEKYLHTDYERLIEEVIIKLWKGKDSYPYLNLINSLKYMEGASELFKKVNENGYLKVIITGGAIEAARRVQNDFGIDHIYANELVIKDGKISGEFVWPVGAGNEKKAQIIKHLCEDLGIALEDVVYIGDSDADSEAFKIVGKSIAFNSSSDKLKRVAKFVVESNNLSDVLEHL